MNLTRERLAELRKDARLERLTMLEHSGRLGQDPAESVMHVPTIDEFVVRALRDELLEDRGQLAEFSMARLASLSNGPEAPAHRRNVDRFEFQILREIAAAVPELTIAVWHLADQLDVGQPGTN